jgi:hypothetical protein
MRHLALYHGVVPIFMEFLESAEDTFDLALKELVRRGYLSRNRLVAIVQSGRTPIWRRRHTHGIQVRGAGAGRRGGVVWVYQGSCLCLCGGGDRFARHGARCEY